MTGVNRMCSRLMKLQGEKSSMQDQQTCATMRSDCPQKAETQNKERKWNRMPSQDKQYQLMLVMKSKKNVGPALLYWQAYQQCVPNENKSEHYLQCQGCRAWKICKENTASSFWGQNRKWLGGWRDNREGEVGEVGFGWVRRGRGAGCWEDGR